MAAPVASSAAAPPPAPPPVSAPPAPSAAGPARSAAPTASAAAGTPRGAPADAGVSDAGASAAGPADAGAAASPALRVAQQVDAIFVGKKTFSARFKQHYTQYVTGTAKDSSGTVSVERPDKISFRYDLPNKNRIVSDGTTIKVYIADDNQMFETPVQKTQYPGALAFMMGNGIATSFNFALDTGVGSTGTVLKGKPLVPNPSYETVVFFIDDAALAKKEPAAMAGVLIRDAQRNTNRFDFQSASQPASFPPDEFTFTAPPGTNVTH
jgi:outer membrane lipoprotein carrier protein